MTILHEIHFSVAGRFQSLQQLLFQLTDESQSTSPDDNAASSGGTEASPRINRFLARLPPDGCEKVSIRFGNRARDKLEYENNILIFEKRFA